MVHFAMTGSWNAAARRAFLAENTARGAALLRAEIPEWSVADPALARRRIAG
jgi:hypothetical protein